MPDTAIIILNVYDGTRQPLPKTVSWDAQAIDGRSLSERHTALFPNLHGGTQALEVPFLDNFGDAYTVIVTSSGYQDGAWRPVQVSGRGPVTLDVMLLPKNPAPNFAGATWDKLAQVRSNVANMVLAGCESSVAASAKYQRVLEQRSLALACFLNITTAMADMRLPSGKSPLDYYWNICWPQGDAQDAAWIGQLDNVFKQDRFFCYVDENILPDVREAARNGAFSQEPNPDQWGHDGATESYKQTQFDVANVQLTFHGRDTATFPDADNNPVKCVKIEPDIDYYKDLVAHGLLEVVPNWLTKQLTDPKVVYCLRWMAARQEHIAEFNPLYTLQA